jgi:hypothetical protein
MHVVVVHCVYSHPRLRLQGTDDVGQIGHGSNASRRRVLTPRRIRAVRDKVVSVAAGSTHALALTEDGRVLSWGSGKDGQLGHGNRSDLALPRQVSAVLNVLWGSIEGRDSVVVCSPAYTQIIVMCCCVVIVVEVTYTFH